MTVVIGVVFDVSNVSGGNCMRYEVITGVERRRRWPDEEKLTILGEVGVDGECPLQKEVSDFSGL